MGSQPAGLKPTRLLQFQGDEQADYDGEQRSTFQQSRYDKHSSLDFARSLRLTADGFHSATADAANTQASAQDSQTSAEAGTHYSQTNRINNLQQQRKKHGKKKNVCREKTWGNKDPAAGVVARLA
jgi:type IV secretory pathway VirD2 relaxase